MKLPKKIRVDNYTYKVVPIKNQNIISSNKRHKHRKLMGEANFPKQKIRISTAWSRDEVAETLLHEIIHCCAEREGLPHDEHYVGRISRRLYQVLKDNHLKF